MGRLLALVLVLALVASACGEVSPATTSTSAPVTAPPAVESSTLPPAPASTSASSSTTITTTSTTIAPPDRATLDRSVLTLGVGDETSGRFQLVPNRGSRLSRTTGTYWVLPDGNVYTRFDLDSALIAEEMEGLIGRLSTHPDVAGTELISELENHYGGDEFQLGITDTLRWFDLRVPSLEVIEQANLIMGAGVFEAGIPANCRKALDAYETAARDWVAGLDPTVDAAGTWVFPGGDFDTALAGPVTELDSCGGFIDEAAAPPEVEFRVTHLDDSSMVEVLADDGLYTDHDPELEFTVMMQPDASVGDMPERLAPTPLLGLASTYLAAIGACGELPWAHTAIAGGDSWDDPAEEPFTGVTFLADRLACPDDVPEDAVNP